MPSLRSLTTRLRTLLSPPPESVVSATCVSYPKAGRTWLRVMLDELELPLAWKHDGSQHTRAIPWQDYKPCTAGYGPYRGERLLLLLRDPRDTAVSGYFQRSRRRDKGYSGEIGDFLRDPRHGIEKIARFNMTWLDNGANHGLPFAAITYEGLRRDTVVAMTKVVDFLSPGHGLSAERIGEAIERCSFKRMQQGEASGELGARYGERLSPGNAADVESFKVRRGKVGGYVDYLSPEDIQWCQEHLESLGYGPCLAARAGRILH